MRNEEMMVIELGTVRAGTRGVPMGIAESEFGWMLPSVLHDD